MSNKLFEIAVDSAVGSFSLFLGETFSILILAVGSIFVARWLGPEGYGVYTLAFVVPILVIYLIELGVDEALIRFPAQSMAQGKEGPALTIVQRGLKFKFLVSSAGSAVVFIFSDMFATYLLRRPELGFYVKIASLAVLLQAVFNSSIYAFIGLNRMTKSATLKGVMSFVRAFSAPILIVLGFGVGGAIAGYLLGYLAAILLGTTILFTAFIPKTEASENEQQSTTLRAMVEYGFPVYLASLLGVLVSQLQFAVLALYSSNSAIGNFNAALNFTMLINVIALPIVLAIFPAFSKLSPENELSDLRRLFAVSAKYASLFILPAAVGAIVLSKELVYTVYGSGYFLAPSFLSLYCVSFLYAVVGSSVLGSFFNGIGETRLNLRFTIISAIIFFLIAPLLTPTYGVEGLIVAYLASGVIPLVYALCLAHRRFKVGVDLGIQVRVGLAAAVPAILTFVFLRLSELTPLLNLILGGTIFVLAYLTLIPLLGAISTDDIQNLTLVFERTRLAWPLMKQLLKYETELLSISRKTR